jgi:hypothetical protein
MSEWKKVSDDQDVLMPTNESMLTRSKFLDLRQVQQSNNIPHYQDKMMTKNDLVDIAQDNLDHSILHGDVNISGKKPVIKVEGYWAVPLFGVPNMDWGNDEQRNELKKCLYNNYYPNPARHSRPWPGQEEFLRKLKLVESKAVLVQSSSASYCRFVPSYSKEELTYRNVLMGSCLQDACTTDEFRQENMRGEYYYKGIVWPSGLSSHDIPLHNVSVTKEFFHFIGGQAPLPPPMSVDDDYC